MARYKCRSCGNDGEFAYEGIHACPQCGSTEVQFALSIEELPDDAPIIAALMASADEVSDE